LYCCLFFFSNTAFRVPPSLIGSDVRGSLAGLAQPAIATLVSLISE
jgi:hypothetical protein